MVMLQFLNRSRSRKSHPAVHMTWASRSIGQSLVKTGVFVRTQIWIWPVIATLLLAIVAYTVRQSISDTMKGNLKSELTTLLNVEVAMLSSWLELQESQAEMLSNGLRLRQLVYQLVGKGPAAAAPTKGVDPATVQEQIRIELLPAMTSYEYTAFYICDRSRKVISASNAELIGLQELADFDPYFSRALEGETFVSPPFSSHSATRDEKGRLQSNLPTMAVCAPLRDETFQVIGAIVFRLRPDHEFTRILQLGRSGESGETYAFNKAGMMVSNSRFDNDLMLLGLLPDREDAHSILAISLRDPQGDMTQGLRPKVRRSELPLTKMALDATAGHDGVDVDGYRDYRGVPVIGAWHWFPKYDFGVTTEIDVSEAFRPLNVLNWVFSILFVLLVIASIAIFVFTVLVARARREARKAAVEARQLGQYTLEDKLGAGAMGIVYRGRHAMMRRPTAIKMLDADKVNDDAIQRFEREVQLCCQLNHSNTVAIYDYGRTPEGVFYYAMEYLDGINLQTLVERYGPQPEGRVIRILSQICGSLFEAHSMGLVHRDIKPANIMINRRGGEADVVKVLDFGLAKAIETSKQAGVTSAGALTGTPLYMSPESIEAPNSVDGRSDLYAVGAVGYFLLTGQPIFTAETILELCRKHVAEIPTPPSIRLGRQLSPELEQSILSCLEKNRARRPQTARDLANMLQRASTAQSWTHDAAEIWWSRHKSSHTGVLETMAHAHAQSVSQPGEASLMAASQHLQTFVHPNDE